MAEEATQTEVAATEAPKVESNTPPVSATQETKQVTPAPGEGQAKTSNEAQESTDKKGDLPAGAKVDFFKLRSQKRELKSENETLRQKLAELETKITEFSATKESAKQEQTAPEKPVSFLDDPDAWAAQVEKRAEQRVLQALQAKEAEQMRYSAAQEGTDYLLTRSHIQNDPNAAGELQQIINSDPDVATIVGVNPKSAAQLAYFKWCESKGITPDVATVNAEARRQAASASGVRSSATSSAGPKVWTRAEVAKYLDLPMGSKDKATRIAEIEKAMTEGRIKK